MSDCLINLRLFYWHFQLKRSLRPRVSFNRSHVGKLRKNGYVRLYEFFGYSNF